VGNDDGTRNTYLVAKFRRSNQGTCFNQKPVVAEGQRIEAGQVQTTPAMEAMTPMRHGPVLRSRRRIEDNLRTSASATSRVSTWSTRWRSPTSRACRIP